MSESQIQSYQFEGKGIRFLLSEDDSVSIVAADLARVLEYRDAEHMTRNLDSDERSTQKVGTSHNSNDSRRMTVITEAGMYKLILQREAAYIKDPDRRAAVERFQRWVTHEVLPQIRRTGGYIPKAETPEETMARAVLIAQRTIKEQKEQLEAQAPKVLFADTVSAARTDILVGDLAKILRARGVEIGGKRLFQWMRDNGYLIKAHTASYNMPTQYSVELGLFHIKETSITHSDGHTTISKTPKVTGKGQIYFVNKFLGKEAE